jgi:hypothetical protein
VTRLQRILLPGLLLGLSGAVHADPWLAPGDEGLRHDIELLADAGILRGPVTTWPLSWPDIARDALSADGRGLDEATGDALLRVQRMSRAASARGYAGAGYRLSGAVEATPLRQFAETPREEGELALRASWLTDHLALNLQGSVVADADDQKTYRGDGSYLGINIGNFMISAGLMERWWGPGWDGSLILSTNARPIPSLTLERNYTDAFKTRWLSWLGPWRASIALGEAETHDVALPGVKFMAARVNFKPRPWLEFGLTRTAQMCGGGRECNWGTFTDMLAGRDNQVDDGRTDDQPGNQMAGYDMRMRSPWKKLPLAVYTQWIGEDEAGGLPSKFMGLAGIEGWTSTGLGSLRVRAEYADTTCTFTREEPDFNCAYRNGIYPQGYSYRGRIIGHSMDNDSRMISIGVALRRPDGDLYSLTLRRNELNRDGGPHAISTAPVSLRNVELRHSRGWGAGKLDVGVGYDDSATAAFDSKVRGFLTWSQGF